MAAVEFVASRRPPLESGVYTVTAAQTVASSNGSTIPLTHFSAAPTKLVVAGLRYQLPSTNILGVYPPAGSTADHSTVLPHVLLKPGTLPWQRSARQSQPGDDEVTTDLVESTPWLALILFDAEEAPELKTVPADQLGLGPAHWWTGPSELGEKPSDALAVIDVPRDLLGELIPAVDELAMLTHVRDRADATTHTEAAVVMGCRLPPPGRTSTVHLVSVEHLVHRQPDWKYRFEELDADALIRLVSLHHWSFVSASPARSFQGLAASLNRTPLTLRLPSAEGLRGRISCASEGVAIHTNELGEVAGHYGSVGAGVEHSEGFGWSLRFDTGMTQPTTMERPLSGASDFTLAAWVGPRDESDPRLMPIIGPSSSTDGVPTIWSGSGGTLTTFMSNDPSNSRVDHHGVLGNAGDWDHFAWVRSGSTDRLFVNGVGREPQAAVGLPVGSSDLWVGTAAVTGGNEAAEWFGGLLADVRVYNRALDANEVANLVDVDRTQHPELAGSFFMRGLVPVEHRLRQGRTAVSWIRGPLSIDRGATQRRPAPAHADGWIEVHGDVGMLDASLAAAWELGRQTMLSSRDAAIALYRWRRATQQAVHRSRLAAQADHLPNRDPHVDVDPTRLPAPVEALLDGFVHLRGVPVNYLVPDPAVLPPESLRLVRLDPVWIDALVRGALSIGAQSSADRGRADEMVSLVAPTPAWWGFLLRSEIVADWPSLVIELDAAPLNDPSDEPLSPLPIVRQDEVAPGVLLILTSAQPRTLTFHLAPEEVHCGVDVDDGTGELKVPIRAADGRLSEAEVRPIPMKTVATAGDRRVIDISALAARIAEVRNVSALSSADLALQMVTGAPRARFVIESEVQV